MFCVCKMFLFIIIKNVYSIISVHILYVRFCDAFLLLANAPWLTEQSSYIPTQSYI